MYYIGQKVVCVKSYGTDPRLIEGQIYRVLDIWSCCSVINLDVGLTHSVGTHCVRCEKQKLAHHLKMKEVNNKSPQKTKTTT